MLPSRCSSPPCRNIAVTSVSQAAIGPASARWCVTSAGIGAVVDDARVRRPVADAAVLQEEVDEHVGRDQQQRDDRQPVGRDVVLEGNTGRAEARTPARARQSRYVTTSAARRALRRLLLLAQRAEVHERDRALAVGRPSAARPAACAAPRACASRRRARARARRAAARTSRSRRRAGPPRRRPRPRRAARRRRTRASARGRASPAASGPAACLQRARASAGRARGSATGS